MLRIRRELERLRSRVYKPIPLSLNNQFLSFILRPYLVLRPSPFYFILYASLRPSYPKISSPTLSSLLLPQCLDISSLEIIRQLLAKAQAQRKHTRPLGSIGLEAVEENILYRGKHRKISIKSIRQIRDRYTSNSTTQSFQHSPTSLGLLKYNKKLIS